MLELRNVTKEYKTADVKVEALKGISLNFRNSEFVSILGPSGCGKTTMLNIIGGLDHYSAGDLIIDGVSTKNYKDRDWDTYRNHSIGFVFQSYNLIMHQSILSNVELSLTLSGVNKEERKKRAIEALEKVGLKEHMTKRPNQLSGGQMQRVAIARAIINNPQIILADEPTGALDSETSVQIMEILKEISKDRLVIMVTHNPELAEKYSTRIIKLLDGKVTSDSNPFEVKTKIKTEKTNKKRNTSMGLFTALHLSINNLLSKKGRTIMTAIAGSIGIIGVALVLALSNGVNGYINTMQSDTLSGYPVSVSTATVDYASITNVSQKTQQEDVTNDDHVVVYDSIFDKYIQFGHYNNINEEFLQQVKQFENQDKGKPESKQILNAVQYNYVAPLKFLYKDPDNKTKLYASNNSLSIFAGSNSNAFYEELSNKDFMMEQYDVVYTSPSYVENDMFGLTLVIEKGNRIPSAVLNCLGVKLERNIDTTYKDISFESICEKTIKLVYNDDYYTIDSSYKISTLEEASEATLDSIYNTASNSLKVTKIIRQKKDSNAELLNSGLMYSHALAQHYLENCKTSEIATKQAELKATESSNFTFIAPYQINISEFAGTLPAEGFKTTASIKAFINKYFQTDIKIQDAYELGMQQIGISKIPQSIFFYTKNFDGKKEVQQMIENYNKTATNENQILYNDQSELITSTLGSVISIISYVLIAFASISLIVSSIMIGVITYTSVIERTKEIGVLRSLGARKKDVSRVFNAETTAVGAFAGLIGVLFSALICIPISLIISSLAGMSITAALSPINIVALITISTALSLIAGLIPSRFAAKQDPVTALRTE